jgi:lipoprotein-anchoring transpeptidase ErfK/SrfK
MTPSRLLAALALAAALLPAGAASRKSPDPARLVAAVENAHKLPTLGPGSQGAPVIRAQALLDRQWFSPGEIDGRFSANMQRAVRAFQFARGLRPSGRVDAPTWQALQADGAAPLAKYVVAEKDVAGPFVAVPKDLMRRATLKRMGYASPLEALAERFHVAPALLQKLNGGRKIATGSELVVPAVRDTKPNAQAASIQVLKGDRQLLLLDAGGRPIAAFPVSIGGRNDPLPVGEMTIRNEVTDPVFHYDPKLMWDAKKHHREVDFAPGPNNPIGDTWLGLSKPHWGIHGTPDPALVGRAETHGCLHLTNWDARRVSSMVKAGFVVDVQP